MNDQSNRKSSLPIHEEGLMDELMLRHEQSRQALQLAEARLAVQRAHAELVDAEIRVKLLQGSPSLESPRGCRDEGPSQRILRADPEASRLQQDLDRAVNRYDKLSQVIRSANDPRLVRAGRDVAELRAQLQQISSRLLLRTLEPSAHPRASAPPPPEFHNHRSSHDIDRKLDLLLDELLTAKSPYHHEPFASAR